MLTKITIEPETVEVFYRNKSLGFFNEYEFNDLRIRIMNQHKGEGNRASMPSDYYVLKDDEKYIIDTHGRLPKWNFFKLYEDQLRELLKF